jgi:hypothetical protein
MGRGELGFLLEEGLEFGEDRIDEARWHGRRGTPVIT